MKYALKIIVAAAVFTLAIQSYAKSETAGIPDIYRDFRYFDPREDQTRSLILQMELDAVRQAVEIEKQYEILEEMMKVQGDAEAYRNGK